MRPLLPVLVALALGVAGCAAPVRPSERLRQVDVRRVEAVADTLARAVPGAARRDVLARALAASGLTPLADGSFRLGLGAPLVGGFVPGRQPLARGTLVVVGTSAEGPSAAALVEAARLVAVRSRWEVAPERTVLFVFWEGLSAGQGIEAALGAPVWPRERVASVLLVGDAPPVGSGRDVPVIVEPLGTGATADDVLRFVARVVEAARDAPAPPVAEAAP